jgi:two-component system, OmpR family, response regulator CpxR
MPFSSFACQHPDVIAVSSIAQKSSEKRSKILSILLVDDDVALGSMLREFLEREGIELSMRHSGELGLAAASTGQYDLILLDVMLPDIDGFEVLQRLRAHSDLSVLLLSARGQPADRIRGLQLGADDYLSKPFDPEELVARIHAVMRRSRKRSMSDSIMQRRISLHNLMVDRGKRTAQYETRSLDLTDIEFSLLEAFVQAPGVVLTREKLAIGIFERALHPLNRNLDMHVCRLRKKLSMANVPGNPIKSIRGSGYLFSITVL